MKALKLIAILMVFAPLWAAEPVPAEDPMLWTPPAGGPKFVDKLSDAAYAKQLVAVQPELKNALDKVKGYPKVGFRVMAVVPNGQAARFKILVGDILTALDDKVIDGKTNISTLRTDGLQKLSVFSPGHGTRQVTVQPGKLGVDLFPFKSDNPFHFDLDFDPDDERWTQELGVARYLYTKNPVLAEAAMVRALRAGLPQSVGVNRIGAELAYYQFHFNEAMAFADAALKEHPDDEHAAQQFYFASKMSYKLEAALKCSREILSHFQKNFKENEPDFQRMISAHKALADDARLAPPPSVAMATMLEDDVVMRHQTFPDGDIYKEDLTHAFSWFSSVRSTQFNIQGANWTRYALLPAVKNVCATCKVRLRPFDGPGKMRSCVCFQLVNYHEELGKDLSEQHFDNNAIGLGLNLKSENALSIYHVTEALEGSLSGVQVDLSDGWKYHALKIVVLNGRTEMFVDGHRCFYGPTFIEPEKTNLCVNFFSSGVWSEVRDLAVKELLTEEEWKSKVVPNINKQFLHKRTRLHAAAQLNDVKTATRLLADGADASIKDAEGMTALDYAVAGKFKGLVDLMLAKKVSKTLLSEVALGEPAAVAEMLKVPGNQMANNAPWSPLHIAVLYGRIEMLKVLLDNGFPINARTAMDRENATPLFLAAGLNNVKVVEYLMSRGADADLRNTYGDNSIRIAEIAGHKDTADLIRKWKEEFKAKQKAEANKAVKPPKPPEKDF